MRNSSLTRKTPIARGTKPMKRSWIKRSRESKGCGLGHAVDKLLGRVFKGQPKEPTLWRSKRHRRNVASLPCVNCGREGETQAAHRNETKGMGIKACDSQLMALCVACHHAFDQGGTYSKEDRRAFERDHVAYTRQLLIDLGLWSPAAQQAYERAERSPTSVAADSGVAHVNEGV